MTTPSGRLAAFQARAEIRARCDAGGGGMSESLELKDVQEQFVNGCLFTGQAYSRDEARGYFTEWLDETIRQAKAEAWNEGWDAGAGWPQDERNPYAEEADHE